MDVAAALARYPGAITYRPGDSAGLNAEILSLMRSGRKTMTCEAWDIAVDDGLPVVGRVDIALDWTGAPALATRTVELHRIAFDAMPEDLVAPQAEFRDLEDWRQSYQRYLERRGVFVPGIEMMVERFAVVEDFASPRGAR